MSVLAGVGLGKGRARRKLPAPFWVRFACAGGAVAALVALLVCAQPLAERFAQQDGLAHEDSQASAATGVWDVASFGLEGADANLASALFAHLSPGLRPEEGLPALFEAEVLAARDLQATGAVWSGQVAGVVSPLEAGQAAACVQEALALHGWTALGQAGDALDGGLDGAGAWQGTYAKEEGWYRWLHVALYPVGGTTTCVVQASTGGLS